MITGTEFTRGGWNGEYWRSLTPDGARREARSRNALAKKERASREKADAERRATLAALGRSSSKPAAAPKLKLATRPAASTTPKPDKGDWPRAFARASGKVKASEIYRERNARHFGGRR